MMSRCPGCADYGLLHKIGGSLVSSPGKTKLDRERTGLCLAEIVSITSSRYSGTLSSTSAQCCRVQEAVGVTARQWRLQIGGGNVREKYRGAVTLLDRLKTLVNDVSQESGGH